MADRQGLVRKELARRELARRELSTRQPESNVQEQGFLGRTFNVPGATSRAAIQSNPLLGLAGPLAGSAALSGIGGQKAQQAASSGALQPDKVRRFQDLALDALHKPASRIAGKIKNPLLQKAFQDQVEKLGLGASGIGLAADIATNPADALLAIAGKTPTRGGTTLGGQIAKSKFGKFTGQFLTKERGVGKSVDAVIDDALPKIVKSPRGKLSRAQIEQSRTRQRDAVKTIVENKEDLVLFDDSGRTLQGKLPENLDQFSQSVDQTKGKIFSEYTSLIEETGQSGKSIDIKPAIKELDKIINNKAMSIKKPQVIDYAQGLKEAILKEGDLPVGIADDLIRKFNDDLNAFYRQPDPNLASNRMVDASVVTKLRSSLDDSVSGFTGKEFQVLKNRYGALRELEEVTNKAFLQNASKVGGGLGDFVSIMGSGDLVSGLVTFDPARIIRGGAVSGLTKLRGILNDPNRSVRKLFKDVDKLHIPRTSPVTPEVLPSKEFGKFGASIGVESRKALPSPKDVPFTPSGSRNVAQKPIIMKNEKTGEIIIIQPEKLKQLGFDPTQGNLPGVIGQKFGPKGRFGSAEFTVR